VRAWTGRLFVDTGTILFVGPGGAADRHRHHAVQLVWALDGALTVTLDAPRRRRAALIPANVAHGFDATGARIALLLVDPHGARGVALDRRARTDPGGEVGDALAPVGVPASAMTPAEATRWCDAATAALDAPPARPALSSTSRRAIAYVEAALDGTPRLTEAARRLGVSPSRLTHVFSREVGIPFRRFVLWTRLQRAVAAVRGGADLTTAAAAAGFSDSAHLSRTCRAMFGLSPSQLVPTPR